jgi:hypothetical protein
LYGNNCKKFISILDKQWQNKISYKTLFNDTSFFNKLLNVGELKIPTNAVNTTPHKHPCEAIGYVDEGEIETKKENSLAH